MGSGKFIIKPACRSGRQTVWFKSKTPDEDNPIACLGCWLCIIIVAAATKDKVMTAARAKEKIKRRMMVWNPTILIKTNYMHHPVSEEASFTLINKREIGG